MRSGLVMDADRAIPLGLIVSELLTNALRHAYPPGVSGTAGIATERVGDMLQVTVADSGRGIPTSPARQGLGTTLVTALTRQVGATLDSTSQVGEGTAIVLRLRLAA
jgi:two-component sensor histidine kinase